MHGLSPGNNPSRILVVEDDEYIARLIALHLDDMQAQLQHCLRGDEALATGLLFVLVGGALIAITTRTSELYSLETTQRINRDIALHAAEDMPLLGPDGVNEAALKELDAKSQRDYLETAHKQCLRLNELTTQEAGITLTAETSDQRIQVYADIAMIHRVLDHLIQNALKHTARGGAIVIRVGSDQTRVLVEVIDDGEGIASRDIPHIFERFYRPETETPSVGHSLGLANASPALQLPYNHANVYLNHPCP